MLTDNGHATSGFGGAALLHLYTKLPAFGLLIWRNMGLSLSDLIGLVTQPGEQT